MDCRRATAVVVRVFRYAAGAAVLSAMGAPAAFAAAGDPVVIAVSGRVNQFFFVRNDTDDPNAPPQDINPVGIFTYSRLTVDARVPLTDSISARGSARFIANTRQPDNMDEVFVELTGNFGRLQLGDRQAANAGMIESVAPQAFLHMNDEIVASAVQPRTEVMMRDGLTFKRFSKYATAVVYQTPRWNTLDLAVGYYANGDTAISTAQRVRTHDGLETTVSSVASLTEDIRYRALVGHYRADLAFFPERISAWNAMFDIFVGPIEVGGTMMKVAPLFGLREFSWALGAMYFQGPWRFSTDFRHARREADVTGATHDKVERLSFQTTYRLGPGINLGGTVFQSFQRDTQRHVWRSRGAILGITVGF